MKVLVTAGSFDGRDGWIFHVDLDRGDIDCWARWTPPPHLAVLGKGFTGGTCHRGALYVAAHAAVVRWDLRTAETTGVLHQPDFNDLHHVAVIGERLLVVNTGADAIERFSLDGVFRGRHALMPSWAHARRMQGEDPSDLDACCEAGWAGAGPTWIPATHYSGSYYATPEERTVRPYHTLRLRDRVHPNHVVDGPTGALVTCLRDRTVRSLEDLEPVQTMPAPPHDGIVRAGQVWMTTVEGRIWRMNPAGDHVECAVDLREFGHRGWCRGLLVTDDIMVVGLTELRQDRVPGYVKLEASLTESFTGLVVVERSSGRALQRVVLDIPGLDMKIYSVLEVP